MDAVQKVIDDGKKTADAVADAVNSGVTAIKSAWDNLDSGLKQWIITGVWMAVSFRIGFEGN